MVVFGKKWLYWCRSGCIRVKVLLIGQKWFYSFKVVLFGQNWLYSGKSFCIRAKMDVFGQNLMYSGKVVV